MRTPFKSKLGKWMKCIGLKRKKIKDKDESIQLSNTEKSNNTDNSDIKRKVRRHSVPCSMNIKADKAFSIMKMSRPSKIVCDYCQSFINDNPSVYNPIHKQYYCFKCYNSWKYFQNGLSTESILDKSNRISQLNDSFNKSDGFTTSSTSDDVTLGIDPLDA